MKRIGLLTSGGDCQALNAAMRGVVKCLVNSGEEVEIYGFLDGYRGLIYGNFRMLEGKDFSGIDVNFCRDGDSFVVGGLQISAFTISHDAREPLQFHMTDGAMKFGMLTDTGQVTPHIANALSGCDALMVECNYDDRMLEKSAYPFYLKKRISSVYGHLSNSCAGEFLAQVDHSRLKKVIGAHLSQNNNLPELAREAIEEVVDAGRTEIVVAGQDDGFEWTEIA